ncbi:hypothetical protein SynROS8604_02470 [Synechococcus sp. ROS8604]|nr:hypothetical protein SynROS8604_02470 [Synechococcus sp. ROS8604]
MDKISISEWNNLDSEMNIREPKRFMIQKPVLMTLSESIP